jgi:hypothetical protein
LKTSELQILELISKDGQMTLAMDLKWSELTQLFAHELAAISHKINRHELSNLLMVGAMLNQKVLKEIRDGIDAKSLLSGLQVRRDLGDG